VRRCYNDCVTIVAGNCRCPIIGSPPQKSRPGRLFWRAILKWKSFFYGDGDILIKRKHIKSVIISSRWIFHGGDFNMTSAFVRTFSRADAAPTTATTTRTDRVTGQLDRRAAIYTAMFSSVQYTAIGWPVVSGRLVANAAKSWQLNCPRVALQKRLPSYA